MLLFHHKNVHTFLKSINPEMNIIARLDFKFIYNDIAIEHINQFISEIPGSLRAEVIYFTNPSGRAGYDTRSF